MLAIMNNIADFMMINIPSHGPRSTWFCLVNNDNAEMRLKYLFQ
jgi:hypothetical protein